MVEADQVLENIELAFRKSGMAEVCRRTGVEWVNMTAQGGETLDAARERGAQAGSRCRASCARRCS